MEEKICLYIMLISLSVVLVCLIVLYFLDKSIDKDIEKRRELDIILEEMSKIEEYDKEVHELAKEIDLDESLLMCTHDAVEYNRMIGDPKRMMTQVQFEMFDNYDWRKTQKEWNELYEYALNLLGKGARKSIEKRNKKRNKKR